MIYLLSIGILGVKENVFFGNRLLKGQTRGGTSFLTRKEQSCVFSDASLVGSDVY